MAGAIVRRGPARTLIARAPCVDPQRRSSGSPSCWRRSVLVVGRRGPTRTTATAGPPSADHARRRPPPGRRPPPRPRPRRGSGQPVTFAFGGDVHFEGGLRSKLDSNPTGMFAPIAPELSAADVAIVNLETAITEGGSPADKEYNFRAPASAFEALRVAGRRRRDAWPTTTASTTAPTAWPTRWRRRPRPRSASSGSARTRPRRTRRGRREVKGQRIAVFGATDVIDDCAHRAVDRHRHAGGHRVGEGRGPAAPRRQRCAAARPTRTRSSSTCTGAPRGSSCPTPRQQELARALVDAGADIVVGSHAHRVMTAGRLGTALVDYGLGNFVFYNESGDVRRHRGAHRDRDRPRHRRLRLEAGPHPGRDPDAAHRRRRRRRTSPRSTAAAPAPTSRP